MNSKFILFPLSIMASLLIVACSADDEDNVQLSSQKLRPLTIDVMETPFVNPDEAAESRATRAAIISSLEGFKIDYVYKSGDNRYWAGEGKYLSATKNGENGWKVGDGSVGWPSGAVDKLVNWYAYTDGTFYIGAAENGEYIDFTVDETASKQKDLLVAKTSGTYSATGGKLSFTFDHACSALRFLVKKSTNLNGYVLTVSKVKLCNVKKSGRYGFNNTPAWSSIQTETGFTLYSTQSGMTLGSESYVCLDTSEAPYLFMIPQTLVAWAPATNSTPTGCYLEIDCTIKGSNDSEVFSGTAYIPFGATLEIGYQYDVKVNIGKNSLRKSDGTQIITG